MRLLHLIIQCIIILPLLAQNPSSNVIDSILKESFQKFAELQFVESSNLANQALHLSTAENYSKGKALSNLYIAKVLTEVGMNMEALEYIQRTYREPFFKKELILQVELHRIKGRIYGIQQLYTLAKEEFNKQLALSENISDPKKRELSKLWAYQNIEHLFSLQELNDSIEVYQMLQEKQLSNFEENEVFYNVSTLLASRGKLLLNKGEFDAAAIEIQKSLDIINKYNSPYKYYALQVFGELEAAKGNADKAIYYYTEALENSVLLKATHTSRDLHKLLNEYMFANDTLQDKAKEHGRIYSILNDSLIAANRLVVDAIFENIMMDNQKSSAKKSRLFSYALIFLIVISLFIGTCLILRNRKNKQQLIEKKQLLISTTEKVELLEEELESTIFQDIITLAKNNNPEFLPLFGKGYPEFIEAMKKLDPSIRSSELHFCALVYLNFSTKDISNFSFVTVRAVQIRKNRLRKKYNIPSEIDLREWFRNLENVDIQ